jgi:hypothetical protein
MTASGDGEDLSAAEAQRDIERRQQLVDEAKTAEAVPPSQRGPRTLDTGSIDPASPGHRWWQYRRMNVKSIAPNGNGNGARAVHSPPEAERAAPDSASDGGPPSSSAAAADAPVNIFHTAPRSGVGYFVLGALLLVATAIASQLGGTGQGVVLVPLAGVLLAVAAGRRIVRRHPDEPWVLSWLVVGTLAKIAACYAHYYSVTVTYGGDALTYDNSGKQFANAWLHGGAAPVLDNLRQTNFLRWFTGVVYYLFGANLLSGTFVYGLLGIIGSYFWYRATVDSVPIVNKKLYLGFVLFVPSIVFWPAVISKEALMQLGLGVVALGAAYVLRQQFFKGLLIAFPGAWLVWAVRPHLLALATIAAAFAYFAGRVRKRGKKNGILSRPIGIIIVALLVVFTVGQAASLLGLKSISASGIQSELDQNTARSGGGGSQFNNGGNSLNPIYLPRDATTVLIRPFPWEAGSGSELVAGLEGAAIAALLILRLRSLRISLARSREVPFLMFCWVFTGLYVVAFASVANFGTLVRERSLVLPAVFALAAVDPVLARRRARVEPAAPQRAGAPAG